MIQSRAEAGDEAARLTMAAIEKLFAWAARTTPRPEGPPGIVFGRVGARGRGGPPLFRRRKKSGEKSWMISPTIELSPTGAASSVENGSGGSIYSRQLSELGL
jgi:hypothetical protein